MSLRIRFAAAVLCSIAGIATAGNLSAQSQKTSIVRNGTPGMPQQSTVEQLPPGQMSGGSSQEYYSPGPSDGGYMQGGEYSGDNSGGCADGYCNGPCCEQSCCNQSCGGCGEGRFFGLRGRELFF